MAARILVADDSVTIQKVVELAFSKENFELIQARSGEEAIRKATEVRPDLVLLDLVMPDKNGYEVCAALRAEPALRNVPIILLTGTFEAFDKEQGLRVGANDFVTKPFESAALLSKVKQLLFERTMKMAAAAPATGATPPVGLLRTAAPPRLTPSRPAAADPAPLSSPPAELPTLELEPGEVQPAKPAAPEPASVPMAEAKGAPPPESFNLDDLLEQAPQAPPHTPSPEAVAPEGPTGEVVIDLTPAADAPPLPLVEVGKGEAPSLSVEDLLSPTDAAAFPFGETGQPELRELDLESPPPAGLMGEVVFDLTPAAEARPLPLVEVGKGEPPSLSVEDLLPPVELEGLTTLPSIESHRASGEAGPEEPAVVSPAASLWEAGAGGEQAPLPFPPAAGPSDMAALRQAVTERVTHELMRDLNEKILERIERVVWEVVPDLAEILITKEIERIRALADEQQPG